MAALATAVSADGRASLEARLSAIHRFWQRGIADVTLD